MPGSCLWCTCPERMRQLLPDSVSLRAPAWLNTVHQDLLYCWDCVLEYHHGREAVTRARPELAKVLTQKEVARLEETFTLSLDHHGNIDDAVAMETLHLPLLEVLKFPYLLLHQKLASLVERGIQALSTSGRPLILEEKSAGVYLLLVHPNRQIRKWAIKSVRSLGMVQPHQYEEIKPVIGWLLSVVNFDLFENPGIGMDVDDPPCGMEDSVVLPPFLFDTCGYKDYWLGICLLLSSLDPSTMRTQMFGASGHRHIPDAVLNAMEPQQGLKAGGFWPALQCLVVLFDRLGSRIWQFMSHDPATVFSTITQNKLFQKELLSMETCQGKKRYSVKQECDSSCQSQTSFYRQEPIRDSGSSTAAEDHCSQPITDSQAVYEASDWCLHQTNEAVALRIPEDDLPEVKLYSSIPDVLTAQTKVWVSLALKHCTGQKLSHKAIWSLAKHGTHGINQTCLKLLVSLLKQGVKIQQDDRSVHFLDKLNLHLFRKRGPEGDSTSRALLSEVEVQEIQKCIEGILKAKVASSAMSAVVPSSPEHDQSEGREILHQPIKCNDARSVSSPSAGPSWESFAYDDDEVDLLTTSSDDIDLTEAIKSVQKELDNLECNNYFEEDHRESPRDCLDPTIQGTDERMTSFREMSLVVKEEPSDSKQGGSKRTGHKSGTTDKPSHAKGVKKEVGDSADTDILLLTGLLSENVAQKGSQRMMQNISLTPTRTEKSKATTSPAFKKATGVKIKTEPQSGPTDGSCRVSTSLFQRTEQQKHTARKTFPSSLPVADRNTERTSPAKVDHASPVASNKIRTARKSVMPYIQSTGSKESLPSCKEGVKDMISDIQGLPVHSRDIFVKSEKGRASSGISVKSEREPASFARNTVKDNISDGADSEDSVIVISDDDEDDMEDHRRQSGEEKQDLHVQENRVNLLHLTLPNMQPKVVLRKLSPRTIEAHMSGRRTFFPQKQTTTNWEASASDSEEDSFPVPTGRQGKKQTFSSSGEDLSDIDSVPLSALVKMPSSKVDGDVISISDSSEEPSSADNVPRKMSSTGNRWKQKVLKKRRRSVVLSNSSDEDEDVRQDCVQPLTSEKGGDVVRRSISHKSPPSRAARRRYQPRALCSSLILTTRETSSSAVLRPPRATAGSQDITTATKGKASAAKRTALESVGDQVSNAWKDLESFPPLIPTMRYQHVLSELDRVASRLPRQRPDPAHWPGGRRFHKSLNLLYFVQTTPDTGTLDTTRRAVKVEKDPLASPGMQRKIKRKVSRLFGDSSSESDHEIDQGSVNEHCRKNISHSFTSNVIEEEKSRDSMSSEFSNEDPKQSQLSTCREMTSPGPSSRILSKLSLKAGRVDNQSSGQNSQTSQCKNDHESVSDAHTSKESLTPKMEIVRIASASVLGDETKDTVATQPADSSDSRAFIASDSEDSTIVPAGKATATQNKLQNSPLKINSSVASKIRCQLLKNQHKSTDNTQSKVQSSDVEKGQHWSGESKKIELTDMELLAADNKNSGTDSQEDTLATFLIDDNAEDHSYLMESSDQAWLDSESEKDERTKCFITRKFYKSCRRDAASTTQDTSTSTSLKRKDSHHENISSSSIAPERKAGSTLEQNTNKKRKIRHQDFEDNSTVRSKDFNKRRGRDATHSLADTWHREDAWGGANDAENGDTIDYDEPVYFDFDLDEVPEEEQEHFLAQKFASSQETPKKKTARKKKDQHVHASKKLAKGKGGKRVKTAARLRLTSRSTMLTETMIQTRRPHSKTSTEPAQTSTSQSSSLETSANQSARSSTDQPQLDQTGANLSEPPEGQPESALGVSINAQISTTAPSNSYKQKPAAVQKPTIKELPPPKVQPSRPVNPDYFLTCLLQWNPQWMEETSRTVLPFPCHGLQPVPQMFGSFDDYLKTFTPLLLLETWEMEKETQSAPGTGKHSQHQGQGNTVRTRDRETQVSTRDRETQSAPGTGKHSQNQGQGNTSQHQGQGNTVSTRDRETQSAPGTGKHSQHQGQGNTVSTRDKHSQNQGQGNTVSTRDRETQSGTGKHSQGQGNTVRTRDRETQVSTRDRETQSAPGTGKYSQHQGQGNTVSTRDRETQSVPGTGKHSQHQGQGNTVSTRDREIQSAPGTGKHSQYQGQGNTVSTRDREIQSAPGTGKYSQHQGQGNTVSTRDREIQSAPGTGKHRQYQGQGNTVSTRDREIQSAPGTGKHSQHQGQGNTVSTRDRETQSAPGTGKHSQHQGQGNTVSTRDRETQSAPGTGKHSQHQGQGNTVSTRDRETQSAPGTGKHSQHQGQGNTVSTRDREPVSIRDRETQSAPGTGNTVSTRDREPDSTRDRETQSAPGTGKHSQHQGQGNTVNTRDRETQSAPRTGKHSQHQGHVNSQHQGQGNAVITRDRKTQSAPGTGKHSQHQGQGNIVSIRDRETQPAPGTGKHSQHQGQGNTVSTRDRETQSAPGTGKQSAPGTGKHSQHQGQGNAVSTRDREHSQHRGQGTQSAPGTGKHSQHQGQGNTVSNRDRETQSAPGTGKHSQHQGQGNTVSTRDRETQSAPGTGKQSAPGTGKHSQHQGQGNAVSTRDREHSQHRGQGTQSAPGTGKHSQHQGQGNTVSNRDRETQSAPGTGKHSQHRGQETQSAPGTGKHSQHQGQGNTVSTRDRETQSAPGTGKHSQHKGQGTQSAPGTGKHSQHQGQGNTVSTRDRETQSAQGTGNTVSTRDRETQSAPGTGKHSQQQGQGNTVSTRDRETQSAPGTGKHSQYQGQGNTVSNRDRETQSVPGTGKHSQHQGQGNTVSTRDRETQSVPGTGKHSQQQGQGNTVSTRDREIQSATGTGNQSAPGTGKHSQYQGQGNTGDLLVLSADRRRDQEQDSPTHVQAFGVVEKVIKQPNIGGSSDYWKLTVCIKVNPTTFPVTEGQTVNIQVVTSLVVSQRQWSGLIFLHRSLLARDILRPRGPSVFSIQTDFSQRAQVVGRYNPMQRAAIAGAAHAALQPFPLPRICLLQGPPGTGKSHTIVGLVRKIIQAGNPPPDGNPPVPPENKPRVLLCAPSNAGIDELVRRMIREVRQGEEEKENSKRFYTGNCGDLNLVRLGRPASIHPDVQGFSLDNIVEKQLKSFTKEVESSKERHIVVQLTALDVKIADLERECGMQRLMGNTHNQREVERKRDTLQAQRDKLDKTNRQVQLKKDEYQREGTRIRQRVLMEADVVCCTLSTSGSNMLEQAISKAGVARSIHFTCAIIDEAGQCNELDALMYLTVVCYIFQAGQCNELDALMYLTVVCFIFQAGQCNELDALMYLTVVCYIFQAGQCNELDALMYLTVVCYIFQAGQCNELDALMYLTVVCFIFQAGQCNELDALMYLTVVCYIFQAGQCNELDALMYLTVVCFIFQAGQCNELDALMYLTVVCYIFQAGQCNELDALMYLT
ncbi:hypothetical protein Bbelb_194080, partial [Branchiostoma belcheri]